MSKCAVHMMKLKMSALGGIQSHNQREHESTKNKEIDYEKSDSNIDTVNGSDINYQKAVKERIDELKLKKAVRKDAVVYCSFIVSSDREFFERLGEKEHIRREGEERESVKYGIEEPTPFEYMPEDYKEDCIRQGSEAFFERATAFFCDRYGAENVINGTVHFDEATPHMHLGIVPVTADGRLSAKDLFNKMELKQLQTEFAEKVGRRFKLERGTEGSEATHLDELNYKIKKRQEQLDKLDEDVWKLESRQFSLQGNCKDLEKQAESLSKTVSELKTDISTLDTQKRLIERVLARLEEYRAELKKAIEKIAEMAKRGGMSLKQAEAEIQREKALNYIEETGQGEKFKQYLKNPKEASVLRMAEWSKSVARTESMPGQMPTRKPTERER